MTAQFNVKPIDILSVTNNQAKQLGITPNNDEFINRKINILEKQVEIYTINLNQVKTQMDKIRVLCAILHPEPIVILNSILLPLAHEMHHLRWITCVPMRIKKGLIAPLAYVNFYRNNTCANILFFYSKEQDGPFYLSKFGRTKRINKMIQEGKVSGIVILSHAHQIDTWNYSMNNTETRIDTLILNIDALKSQPSLIVENLSSFINKKISHRKIFESKINKWRTNMLISSIKETDFNLIDENVKKLISILSRFPLTPRFLINKIYDKYLKIIIDNGIAEEVYINKINEYAYKINSNWLAIWGLAHGLRTDILLMRHTYAYAEISRRPMHTFSAYKILIKAEEEITNYNIIHGDAYRPLSIYGEHLAHTVYQSPVDPSKKIIHSPDGLINIIFKNKNTAIFLEVDGWINEKERMRAHSTSQIWISKLIKYFKFYKSNIWKMKFSRFPSLLIVGESSHRTLGLLMEAVRHIPGTEMKIYLTDAEEVNDKGLFSATWTSIPERIRHPGVVHLSD